MKLIKTFFAILILFIVIALGAMTALVLLVNPNQLKPTLTAEVKKATGYYLTINGNLTWTLYPKLGINIPGMTLSQSQQTSPFLELTGVHMATKLTELIKGIQNKKLLGKLNIDQVTFAKLHAQQVNVDLHWQNHILTLQPIRASLYQGSLEGTIHGSAFSTTPHWDGDMKLQRIDVQSLLHEMSAGDSKFNIAGTGEANLVIATQGKSKAALLKQLTGTADIEVKQGFVTGINLNYLIQLAIANLENKTETENKIESLSHQPSSNQTQFDSLITSFLIEEGEVKTRHLSLTAPAFIVTGDGSYAILPKTIDLALQVKPQQTMSEAHPSFMIPVLIQGEIDHPDVRLDMDSIRKMVLKKEIEKAKNKVQDVIKEHVSPEAAALLQNLLSR